MTLYDADQVKEVAEVYFDVFSWAGGSYYDASYIPQIRKVIARGKKIPEEIRTKRFGPALKRLESILKRLQQSSSD